MAQLQTKVDQLLSKGGGLTSCVKSVQRGLIKSQEVTTNDPEIDLKYAFINIQPINPDKEYSVALFINSKLCVIIRCNKTGGLSCKWENILTYSISNISNVI